jgi:hypothetical protein
MQASGLLLLLGGSVIGSESNGKKAGQFLATAPLATGSGFFVSVVNHSPKMPTKAADDAHAGENRRRNADTMPTQTRQRKEKRYINTFKIKAIFSHLFAVLP